MRGAIIEVLLGVTFLALGGSGRAETPADPAGAPAVVPFSLSGTVVDSTGAAVAGASVALRAGRPEVVRRAASDATGQFVFDDVPPGPARVTATLEQFAPASVEVAGPRTDLRLVLKPQAFTDQVTVSAPGLVVTRTSTATKTDTLLRDVPQAVSVVTREQIADQRMQGIADVVRYVPGVGIAQGEGNRDTPIFRGNSSTSDFFVDGIRDDVQYFRDLYNVERVEALKGPNGMIFGRGGVGGVINRVTRQAEPGRAATREAAFQLGSWGDRRVTSDLGRALGSGAALRVTGMYEQADSYRDSVSLERYGINPTVAASLGPDTTLRLGYEHFHDERTADRGIPSYEGRPLATDASTFFGDPDESESVVTANVASALVEHHFGSRFTLRNRTSYGDYDKLYQNVFPGAVNAAGTEVAVSGYSNGTRRRNLFNQTDLVFWRRALGFDHTLLVGMELGRQETDNLRNTAYFTSIGPTTTSVSVPVANPVTSLPIELRPSATDADNHGVATTAALYVQDQLALSRKLQAVLGLRYDRFDMDFTNHRTASGLESRDDLFSPRVGLVFKPAEPVSLYASYSLSHLPRAGEQLGSLSLTNQALEPESFTNYELGAKWDLGRGIALTAAAYRLDRGNVIVPDPQDPTRSQLVDAQRTKGVELGVAGNLTAAWSVAGGYAWQDGEITRSLSATVPAGARLAQLPEHSFSLWNRYDFSRRWGAGVGVIHRSEVFSSTDNGVVLPSFTRVDAALFFSLGSKLRAQLNVENLFDVDYYSYAHSNNNITPGSPRALRAALTTRF
jgi:catecholate siderophore receptor